MKKRKKLKKLWVVLTLFISLISVQTMQIMAEASTENVDFSNPVVVVSSFSELQNAVENANDGDVIGFDSVITIDTSVGQLGSIESGKHLYLVRMDGNACFDILQGGNITFCNMTIDGRKSQFAGTPSMFRVEGMLFLNSLTVQNCSSQDKGGAVLIESNNGTLVTEGVVFDGNSAYEGGHIFSNGNANINNSILKNGNAGSNGGAVKAGTGSFLSLTNCKLYENRALAYGGGISNSGNTTLSGSIVFGNTAPAGADIANDMYAGRFGMDDIENMASAYEEEGVTPVEWTYDCAESTPDIEALFDSGNPNSLLKLIYEDHRSGIGDTGDDTGDDGENTGDNTGNTGGGADNTGNTGDNGNNAGDNTGNTGGDTGNINAGDNSGNDGTGDKENTGNNMGAPETSAAKNENASQTTNNTDSHENKSTTNTTTNYYYADNTPTSTPNLSVSEKQSNNNSSVVPKEEAVSSENVNGHQNVSDNIQIPDNIKLNLYNVDIVYEMTDGISDIAISNEKELAGQSGNMSVVSESSATAGTAPDDEPTENKSFSANWYEVIKMVLLAAILLVVIPRTRIKKTGDIIEE